MENPFLTSLFVQPPTLLGRQLRPFSAYHLAALILLDSPFVKGGTVDGGDLILACYICAYGIEEGPGKLFPEPDLEDVQEKAEAFDFEGSLQAFEAYMKDYLECPELWPQDGETKESGLPRPFFEVATVLEHMTGLSEAAAWDMPFNKLVGYRCAIAESQGWRIVSEKQQAALAQFDDPGDADNG